MLLSTSPTIRVARGLVATILFLVSARTTKDATMPDAAMLVSRPMVRSSRDAAATRTVRRVAAATRTVRSSRETLDGRKGWRGTLGAYVPEPPQSTPRDGRRAGYGTSARARET